MRHEGELGKIEYDYLINATGPRLTFDATPGLGPDGGGNSLSVCTKDHAVHCAAELTALIDEMKTTGRRATLVVGMGHGTCTCEGAAFEYVFNVDHELRRAGVREQADLVYLTNEAELGDFGVGGMASPTTGTSPNPDCGPSRSSASAASTPSSAPASRRCSRDW